MLLLRTQPRLNLAAPTFCTKPQKYISVDATKPIQLSVKQDGAVDVFEMQVQPCSSYSTKLQREHLCTDLSILFCAVSRDPLRERLAEGAHLADTYLCSTDTVEAQNTHEILTI